MIVRERKIDDTIIVNQNDPPLTISRKHIMIAAETFLISEETFLISESPGSNEDESVDHFVKTITIVGNHKSIFTKRKNDFAKEKNQNDLPGNRSCGNFLQKSGNKLNEDKGFFPKAGNVLQEDYIFLIFPGNKLKELGRIVQKARNKLKKDEGNLKNLGKGIIFVETFRKTGNPFSIADCGFRIAEGKTGKLGIADLGDHEKKSSLDCGLPE